MQTFFNTVFRTLKKENDFIEEKLLSKTEPYYKNWHSNVFSLYETTMAYLIYKNVLKTNSEIDIFHEDQYPKNPLKHCDLTIKKGEEKAYIEIKLWKTNDYDPIIPDLKKLTKETNENASCFELIIWQDSNIVNTDKYIKDLENDLNLKKVNVDTFPTKSRFGGELKEQLCVVGLFELTNDDLPPYNRTIS
jgi:hypothetical protein